MNKLVFILGALLLVEIGFISSIEISSTSGVVFLDSEMNREFEKDCCIQSRTIGQNLCYNETAIIVKPFRMNKDLIYCNEENMFVGFPYITGQPCKNDSECESKECSYGECAQKREITISEIYKNKTIAVQNLFFLQNETFYFNGLENIHSIKFVNNGTGFFLFSDGVFFQDISSDKLFTINNNTQFILNGVIFEDSIAKANVTFVESKNLINDSVKLLEQLTCGESCSNKVSYNTEDNFTEIPSEESSTITGNVIQEEPKQNFLDKIISFFKNLF